MTGPVNGNLPPAPFAARLRSLMLERRMSVGQLEKETGITARLIRHYRAGGSVPRDYFGEPTRNAFKIAEALGCMVEDLLPDEPVEKAA